MPQMKGDSYRDSIAYRVLQELHREQSKALSSPEIAKRLAINPKSVSAVMTLIKKIPEIVLHMTVKKEGRNSFAYFLKKNQTVEQLFEHFDYGVNRAREPKPKEEEPKKRNGKNGTGLIADVLKLKRPVHMYGELVIGDSVKVTYDTYIEF